MITKKTSPPMTSIVITNLSDPPLNSVYLPIILAVAMSIVSLSLVTKTVRADNKESQDIQHYRNTAAKNLENKVASRCAQNEQEFTSLAKNTQLAQQTEAVIKPKDGKGALPTFAQADVNKDHYVTKAELKNFPYLLQVFDKVDAGKDGKLEQHEYQNLKMETKREGEIS